MFPRVPARQLCIANGRNSKQDKPRRHLRAPGTNGAATMGSPPFPANAPRCSCATLRLHRPAPSSVLLSRLTSPMIYFDFCGFKFDFRSLCTSARSTLAAAAWTSVRSQNTRQELQEAGRIFRKVGHNRGQLVQHGYAPIED